MPQYTFHLGDSVAPTGYQLYCDPSGGCLIDDWDDRAIIFDGPLRVSGLEMSLEAGGLQRTTLTAEVLGSSRMSSATYAKTIIGELANASIPELLAALNQRMDERANASGAGL
jgi:hypothetical protein